MRKLLKGIIEFRNKLRPEFCDTFARLALGQIPDALYVTCSDSRVAVNVFASTDPGDLFVVRNVGNLVPACGSESISKGDVSVAAAIEFALLNLSVRDIIICGHSECGAMQAIAGRYASVTSPNLSLWLRQGGEGAHERLYRDGAMDDSLSLHNQLSQANVLEQLDHLMTYPMVRSRVAEGKLGLHGWWFDIASATVHAYEHEIGRFVPIDVTVADRILAHMRRP